MDIDTGINAGNLAVAAAAFGAGIATEIINRHTSKYARSEDYLEQRIKENGVITQDDIDVAAQLLMIPQYRKRCRSAAKVIAKANPMCAEYENKTHKKPNDVDDDWLTYFLDRASLVSDDTVQTLWASIFTYECFEGGRFRKVMLDKMAQLDRDTAIAFGTLCSFTYDLSISDGRNYSIPLYLRDDVLLTMVNDSSTTFSRKDMATYKDSLPSVEQLELLQDIGLITLSAEYDDSDIYGPDAMSFMINTQTTQFPGKALYDRKHRNYYILTGNATYTRSGLELYHAIKENFIPNEDLTNIINCFLRSMKKI